MPNISKVELDNLKATIEIQQKQIDDERTRRHLAEAKVAKFNDILDSILTEATRQEYLHSIIENVATEPQSQWYGPDRPRYSYADRIGASSVSIQKLMEKNENLTREVIELESRLAAVSAVVRFAKNHKV